jgi:peptide/nickel transport system ATP-binding protein
MRQHVLLIWRITIVESTQNNALLDVKHLKLYFPVTRGLLRKQVAEVKAVDDVSFKVDAGETMGLVGESGCGKTTVGRGILRLCEPTAGEVFFEGENILKLSGDKMRQLRRKMSLIFQDPYGSLDPRQSAGSIVGELLTIHHIVNSKSEYNDRIEQLFRRVGLDPGMTARVPHEFSGGQRQRLGIARALACEPSLIICDEPISALDVSIQAQIINLLQELQQGIKGLSYLFIAHDLSVVKHISDRIAVMYLGHIVEITDSEALYRNPLHPYTRALLSAVPIADPFVEENREHILLKGEVPSPLNPPSGCTFHPRCTEAIPECSKVTPQLVDIGNRHEVACIRVKA